MQGQEILSKAAATIEMTPTQFKTGSDGFRGQGKVIEDGVKYQVQVVAVRVGSKNGNGKGNHKVIKANKN
jgi:hypothetical protein